MLGGIWHGAAWTFVIWGALHGIAIVVHRLWQRLGYKLHKFTAWAITFVFINVTWVFFRASSFENAINILGGMCGLNGINLPRKLERFLSFLGKFGIKFGNVLSNLNIAEKELIFIIPTFLFLLFICVFMRNSNEKTLRFSISYKTAIFCAILFFVAICSFSGASEFLYFNF